MVGVESETALARRRDWERARSMRSLLRDRNIDRPPLLYHSSSCLSLLFDHLHRCFDPSSTLGPRLRAPPLSSGRAFSYRSMTFSALTCLNPSSGLIAFASLLPLGRRIRGSSSSHGRETLADLQQASSQISRLRHRNWQAARRARRRHPVVRHLPIPPSVWAKTSSPLKLSRMWEVLDTCWSSGAPILLRDLSQSSMPFLDRRHRWQRRHRRRSTSRLRLHPRSRCRRLATRLIGLSESSNK